MAANFSNSSMRVYDELDWGAIFLSRQIIFTTHVILGTFINVMLFVIILKSPVMRSRFRNQIICNCLLVNLADTVILKPLYLGVTSIRGRWSIHLCNLISIYMHLDSIQDFVGNWSLVTAILSLLAQVCEFDPTYRFNLNPLGMTLAKLGVLVCPWLVALIIIPVVTSTYQFYYPCLLYSSEAEKVFIVLNSLLPHSIAFILICVVTFFSRRRRSGGVSQGSYIKTELVERSQEQFDNAWPYVGLWFIALATDTIQIFEKLGVPLSKDFVTRIILFYFSNHLLALRVYIFSLGWLLLPDFREHVKSKLPFFRTRLRPGIDLTFSYSGTADA